MKTIEYRDLQSYGINPLTGEACPFGLRVLCDLTAQGHKIVCDMLGADGIDLPKNWNGGAQFSMMIPRSLLQFELQVWCLIATGCDEVLARSDGIIGREPSDSDEEWSQFVEDCRHFYKDVRLIYVTGGPRRGTRATHAMSGRTV